MAAFRRIGRWFSQWPRPVRWSWPATPTTGEGPAELVALRFTDVDRRALEIQNRGAGEALDIVVRLWLRLDKEQAQRRGVVSYLGAHTRYVVELTDAPLPDQGAPPGVWTQVTWRNRDGAESESWAHEHSGRLEAAEPPFEAPARDHDGRSRPNHDFD